MTHKNFLKTSIALFFVAFVVLFFMAPTSVYGQTDVDISASCDAEDNPIVYASWMSADSNNNECRVYHRAVGTSPAGTAISDWITGFFFMHTNPALGDRIYRVECRPTGGMAAEAGEDTVYVDSCKSIESDPEISVTPSSRSYGNVCLSSIEDRTFTIENTGGGTLSGSVSVSSTFSCVSGCSYSLDAGQTQTVTIRFSPTSAESVSRTVSFSGGGGVTATVSGTGEDCSDPIDSCDITFTSSPSSFFGLNTGIVGYAPNLRPGFTASCPVGTKIEYDLWYQSPSVAPGTTKCSWEYTGDKPTHTFTYEGESFSASCGMLFTNPSGVFDEGGPWKFGISVETDDPLWGGDDSQNYSVSVSCPTCDSENAQCGNVETHPNCPNLLCGTCAEGYFCENNICAVESEDPPQMTVEGISGRTNVDFGASENYTTSFNWEGNLATYRWDIFDNKNNLVETSGALNLSGNTADYNIDWIGPLYDPSSTYVVCVTGTTNRGGNEAIDSECLTVTVSGVAPMATLIIRSSNPNAGVEIITNPPAYSGTTPHTITSETAIEVDLFAPSAPDGSPFAYWTGNPCASVAGRLCSLTVQPESMVEVTAHYADGERSIAVILLQFEGVNDPDNPRPSISRAEDIFFGAEGSVKRFFEENSNNDMTISGDVYGWYTLSRRRYDEVSCNSYRLWRLRRAAWDLAKNDMQTQVYSHRVYIMWPNKPDCNFGGLAKLGGDWSIINGSRGFSWRTISHEIGHNLKLGHAKALDCGTCQENIVDAEFDNLKQGEPVLFFEEGFRDVCRCRAIEYGNPFDTMGVGWGHFSLAAKKYLGWTSSITNVNTDRSFVTVNSLDSGRGVRAGPYWIEYRSPTDSFWGLQTRGVTIHRRTKQRVYLVGPKILTTYLHDTTPSSAENNIVNPNLGGANQRDAYLRDGQSFYGNNITITQISHNNSSAAVSIEFGTPSCSTKQPVVSINLKEWWRTVFLPGASVNYDLEIINNDPPNCRESEFNLSISLDDDLSLVSLFPNTVTLRPSEMYSTTLVISSETDIEGGHYNFSVNASHGNDSSVVGSAEGTHVIFDKTSPNVAIISPDDGEVVSCKIELRAEASDNSGINYVEFYRNGNVIEKSYDEPYNIIWDTTNVLNGAYSLMVLAEDGAGNTAWSSPVEIQINNNPNMFPPNLSIITPRAGEEVQDIVPITASASTDGCGIKKVEFFINGTLRFTADAPGPYVYEWDSRTVADGVNMITVVAHDHFENTSEELINIVVNNGGGI